jgi:hypothetical protein
MLEPDPVRRLEVAQIGMHLNHGEPHGGSGRLRDPRLACFVLWDRIGASRRLDVPQSGSKAPARPGLSLTQPCDFFGGSLYTSSGHRSSIMASRAAA